MLCLLLAGFEISGEGERPNWSDLSSFLLFLGPQSIKSRGNLGVSECHPLGLTRLGRPAGIIRRFLFPPSLIGLPGIPRCLYSHMVRPERGVLHFLHVEFLCFYAVNYCGYPYVKAQHLHYYLQGTLVVLFVCGNT